MRNPEEILQELLNDNETEAVLLYETERETASYRSEEYYQNAIDEFKEYIDNRPANSLAYAGMAYCKAKMDYSPLTVIEYFELAILLNAKNPIIWDLLTGVCQDSCRMNLKIG